MSNIYKNAAAGPAPPGTVISMSAEGGTKRPPDGTGNYDFSGQITAYPTGTQTVTFSDPSNGIMHADAVFPHWQVISASQSAAKSQGYLINQVASTVTITLPTMPLVGDSFVVSDIAGGKFIIGQNNGDDIRLGIEATTVGINGKIISEKIGATLTLVCWASGPGASWVAIQPNGNFMVV